MTDRPRIVDIVANLREVEQNLTDVLAVLGHELARVRGLLDDLTDDDERG